MAKQARPSKPRSCPCGSGDTYEGCCGPIHENLRAATTAEALMRSRYSAFVLEDVAHLERSWHPDTRPGRVRIDPTQEWTGLRIVATERGRALDATGIVEFVATSLVAGEARTLTERSVFERVDGAWVYVAGEVRGGDR